MKPITKERFFEVAAVYGCNRQLASDLWYCRPVDHLTDTEDEITGNLKLLDKDWIARMNPKAVTLERHIYVAGCGGDCAICKALKRSPIHNLEPVETPGLVAFTDRGRVC
jgi:hypothetical protein